MTKLAVENTIVYNDELTRGEQNEEDTVANVMDTVATFVTCLAKNCVWRFSQCESVAVLHVDHVVVDGTFITTPEKLPDLIKSRVEEIVSYAFDLLEDEVDGHTMNLKVYLSDYNEGVDLSYSPWMVKIDDEDGDRNLGMLTITPATKF